MLKITYYASLNKLIIDLKGVVCGDCEVIFQVTGIALEVEHPVKLADDKVPLAEKVVSITEASGKFPDVVFPRSGVTLIDTDQFVLFSDRRFLLADDQINLVVTANGATAQTTFTVPRPPKPFPSWVWTAGQWSAPVPMPSDASPVNNYQWDESVLAWEPV